MVKTRNFSAMGFAVVLAVAAVASPRLLAVEGEGYDLALNSPIPMMPTATALPVIMEETDPAKANAPVDFAEGVTVRPVDGTTGKFVIDGPRTEPRVVQIASVRSDNARSPRLPAPGDSR